MKKGKKLLQQSFKKHLFFCPIVHSIWHLLWNKMGFVPVKHEVFIQTLAVNSQGNYEWDFLLWLVSPQKNPISSCSTSLEFI